MAVEARGAVRFIPFSACKLPVGTTTLGLLHPADLSGSPFGYPGNILQPRPDNLPPQRDELKREYDRGPTDICVRQVTALLLRARLAAATELPAVGR